MAAHGVGDHVLLCENHLQWHVIGGVQSQRNAAVRNEVHHRARRR